jgi:hypothetical protein
MAEERAFLKALCAAGRLPIGNHLVTEAGLPPGAHQDAMPLRAGWREQPA